MDERCRAVKHPSAGTGVVATSERRAARFGAEILARGGSAVDGALAAAITLTVTEPTSNGLGGDLFAIVADGSGIAGLDASGCSPARLSADALRTAGRRAMPTEGWLPVTVPGQVAGWEALHRRYGRLGWEVLFTEALTAGREGFEVGPVTAAAWSRARARLERFTGWRQVFLRDGRTPAAAETWRLPELADTLERLVVGGASVFYREVAARIVAHAEASGGLLGADDFEEHRVRWVEPLRLRSGGFEVVELPAPTQGQVTLEALGLLDGLDPTADPAVALHREIEAVKLAFADAHAALADPEAMELEPGALLDPQYLALRRRSIDDERAASSLALYGGEPGTVLVCAADAAGQVVSLIQSNYMGFGSGIVVPGTGVALHNRGAGFSLLEGHPNEAGPRKRPFHTLMPGLLLADGRRIAMGCMGGQMQPQGHLQLVRALSDGAPPQAAIDRARWRWLEEGVVLLEGGFDAQLASALERRGHRVEREAASHRFGGAQLAGVDDDGKLVAASDPRKDGEAAWAPR